MMVSKIDTIGRWGARAALASAMEEVQEKDGVMVIILHKTEPQQTTSYRSANLSHAEAVYLMRECELKLFLENLD